MNFPTLRYANLRLIAAQLAGSTIERECTELMQADCIAPIGEWPGAPLPLPLYEVIEHFE